MGIVDGMGGEEVNQEVTSTAIISGTNVYATTAVYAPTISATTGTFTGVVSDSVGALSACGTGSPTTWGQVIQAGSAVTGGGSNAWVSFGTAFSAAPVSVNVDSIQTLENSWAPAGSWTAGSFYAETVSASQKISWIAVGPE